MTERLRTQGPPTSTETPPMPSPPPEPPAGIADRMSIRHPRLPRWAPWLVAALAGAVTGVAALTAGWSLAGWAVLSVVVYAVVLPVWSGIVENARAAKDRLVTTLVWSSFAVAMVPLVALVTRVLVEGAPVISSEFLSFSMRNVIGEGGGIYHAVLGTLLITLAATVISVPVGLLAAVYLVEYGENGRTARTITFLVDVMTGIPSIVAGLFAYALFAVLFGPGVRFGVVGAVALSVLMIPVVVRSCEEMLRLVPNELREAAYAIGVPKWLVIVKVVLRTAVAGLGTGIMLAVARVIGETAPLLITVGVIDSINYNVFEGRMMSLPVYVYRQYSQGLVPCAPGAADCIETINYDRAWAAALTLILIVMLLNLVGRLITRFFAPPTLR
jgi:phosphate transport system permease protein